MENGKHLLFEKQAEIAKAVAHPLRIAIVDFLKDGEKCVCDIAEHIGSERSNVSRHLSVMVKAGILTGAFYVQAAALFLTAAAMAFMPDYAHVIFGFVAAACFFFPGLHYYRQRERLERDS